MCAISRGNDISDYKDAMCVISRGNVNFDYKEAMRVISLRVDILMT